MKTFKQEEWVGWTISENGRGVYRWSDQKKIKKKFLILPLTIGYERKWLCWASFEIQLMEGYFYSYDYEQSHDYCLGNYQWYCTRWV